MNEFGSCWGMTAGSLLIAAPVIFFRVQDHSSLEEDLRLSDETAGDIGIPMQEKGESDTQDKGEFDHASFDNKESSTHDNNDNAVELADNHDNIHDDNNKQPPTYTENKESNAN